MKIGKDFDPRNGAPDISKGTDPFDNPGIQVNKTIPLTPGEKASNPAAAFEQNKRPPMTKGGSGYTNG